MLHRALHEIPLAAVDLLFIENVGNLVCPASFDLGQHRNVVLLSVPEGDDKPEKYPVMFRTADLVLLTKTDLLEHIPEFDVQRARGSLRSIAAEAPMLSAIPPLLQMSRWICPRAPQRATAPIRSAILKT